MNQEKIGKFIAQKRKEKNLKQEDLASLLGVSAKTISRWETGRNMPDLALLKPLSYELGITIHDLLSGEVVEQKDYPQRYEENINKVLIKAASENKRKLGFALLIMASILIFYHLVLMIMSLTKEGINYFYLLDQNLAIIPFVGTYSGLKYGFYQAFLQNCLVNFSFTFLTFLSLSYLKITRNQHLIIFIVVTVLKELLKWLLLIGPYDIDDILMQILFYFILEKILRSKNMLKKR